MMTDSEIIAVVQAHAEGRKIQCNYKNRANIDWWNVACPNWDFSEYDFRVAPEPHKPREWIFYASQLGDLSFAKFEGSKKIKVREILE